MSLGRAKRPLRVAWAIGAPLCAFLVVAAVTVLRVALRVWARPDDGSDAQWAGNVLMFLFIDGLVWAVILVAYVVIKALVTTLQGDPRLSALSELGHSTESGLTAVDSLIRTLTDRGWLLTDLSLTAGAHANDVPTRLR